MSTTSTKVAKKVAAETALPIEKPKVARSTTSQRAPRSLREKVLVKAVTRKADPEEAVEIDSDEDSSATTDDSSKRATSEPALPTVKATRSKAPQVTASAEDRVAAWAQAELPPRPIDSDDESAVSFPESSASELRQVGRPSFILTSSKRRAGVEMDCANKLANEMLQSGKEALEQAGNMKKECKVIVLDSLQTMYETVLAISDSRSRHKFNLEKERARHAQELVRVERAHNKQLADMKKDLATRVEKSSLDVGKILKESKAIRDWLSYETTKPHSQIAEISQAIARLEQTTKELTESVNLATGHKTNEAEKVLLVEHQKLHQSVDNISRQLDALRRDTTESSTSSTAAQKTSARAVELLESRPTVSPAVGSPNDRMEQEVAGIKQHIKELRDEILQKVTTLPPVTPIATESTELAEHLQPITERLEAVSSELRTMRELRQRTPPPQRSLEAELAQLDEAKGRPKTSKQPSYAQIAAATPKPRPNHTLIVSATDPKKTGENIIETIRLALDSGKTEARVDRVRKAKNQKVVLSCSTKEDLALLQNRVGANKGLKVEVAKTANPLIKIKDVLAYHKDEEIVNQIRAKNKEIFVGLDKTDDQLRVRYRKRARNPLECHPVLEVSPALYNKFLEAGVVYIGLQRRPVEDQSPLVQCARCLGYGHTKTVCREPADLCSYCGGSHSWEKCNSRQEGKAPSCKNCTRAQNTTTSQAHAAYSADCPERQKWDAIARSRVSYC